MLAALLMPVCFPHVNPGELSSPVGLGYFINQNQILSMQSSEVAIEVRENASFSRTISTSIGPI